MEYIERGGGRRAARGVSAIDVLRQIVMAVHLFMKVVVI